MRFEPPPDTRRIPIVISGGGCFDASDVSVDRVEVEEGERAVVITAYIRRPRSEPDDGCDRLLSRTVRLTSRLERRELLDGSHDPPAPLGSR